MRIPSTRIRNKLKSDQAAFGVTLQMPSPDEVEIAGHAGLDYIWIDAEHGTMDLGDINVMVRAADAVGIDSIVRVPDQTPSFVQRVLDTGATGILVPHMRTPEDARAIVAAATYAPPGIRGACPTIRAFGHMSANWAEDLSRARKDVLVFGLIEDIEGVENIEAIAAAGLDAVMFGPFDLAVTLGLDGNVQHPKIVEAAIVGVPDKKWGETVKAVVVVKKGESLSEAEVIDHCRQYLSSYKKPTSVAFLDALPKTQFGGKVLKRELRERFSKKD